MRLDTSFDFRSDAGGRDPDSDSPMLRRYHKALWSKPLPSGVAFDLDDTTAHAYLHHRSDLGEFWLASDTVITTFTRYIALRSIVDQLPEEENEHFRTTGYTIGGMTLFPGDKRDGKLTINGARGFLRRISDRMDLTLECIRRHYRGEASPLGETLARYDDFFALFDDFRGYVNFFLFQDLVDRDHSAVRFFMPFDDFATPAIPKDVETYRECRRRSIEFVEARNRRIDALAVDVP